MPFPYSIADCPGWVPGMSLPHNVCERCGGDKFADHQPGNRSEAGHTVFTQFAPPAPTLSRDQKAQGIRSLGPFPTEVEYPCGCVATGGNGLEPFPEECPNHRTEETTNAV